MSILPLLLLIGGAAQADPVNRASYNALSAEQFVDFQDLGGVAGTLYDSILYSAGVGFAERFSGQTVTSVDDFDVLGGAPSNPLTLLPGVSGENLAVADANDAPGDNLLVGVGPPQEGDRFGNGSIAMLFSSDQSQFGFSVYGGSGLSASVQFFRRDGSLIDTLTLPGLRNANYGFAREDGITDIAGIAISNNDPEGIGIDNLKHDVISQVPEPASYATLFAGLAFVGALRRRSRRAS